MNLSKNSCNVLFLICFFPVITFGQAKTTLDQRDIWKSRADALTFVLVKEANKTEPLKRSLTYAQLGNLWWKFDSNQSNIWFEKAVDTLIYKTDEESNSETYFQTISEILKIISNRNQKQTDRLIKLLSETDKVSDKDKNSNADSLIELALLLVKENPEKAAALGVLAFKVGQPNNYDRLYWELRRYAPSAADKFFKAAISSALAAPSSQAVTNLRNAVFPEMIIPNAPAVISSPDSIKIETLNFFGDYMLQQQAKFSAKLLSSCESEAFSLAPLRNQFDALSPQKTGIVEQAVSICLSNKNQAVRDLTTTGISVANKRNIDEILKLADEAKGDPKIRAYYLFRAAALADEQKKYKIAAEILDNMSKEERENDAEFWEELRYTVASGYAYQQYQEQDFSGAIRTLEAVPAANRGYAKVGFALKFSTKDTTAREFVLERVKDARADFIKSEKPFAEKSGFWFQIVKLYSNYSMPADAAEAFKEIVKDFNKSLSDNKVKNKPVIKSETITAVISPDLLEAQDHSLFESVSLIQDEKSRLEVNLALLKTTLKKYETLKIKDAKNSDKV